MQMIIFELILTTGTFETSVIFGGSWGSMGNWLEPYTKQPLQILTKLSLSKSVIRIVEVYLKFCHFNSLFPPGWCNVSNGHRRTDIFGIIRWLDQGKQLCSILAQHLEYTKHEGHKNLGMILFNLSYMALKWLVWILYGYVKNILDFSGKKLKSQWF